MENNNLERFFQTTLVFLKQIQQKINCYVNDIDELSRELKCNVSTKIEAECSYNNGSDKSHSDSICDDKVSDTSPRKLNEDDLQKELDELNKLCCDSDDEFDVDSESDDSLSSVSSKCARNQEEEETYSSADNNFDKEDAKNCAASSNKISDQDYCDIYNIKQSYVVLEDVGTKSSTISDHEREVQQLNSFVDQITSNLDHELSRKRKKSLVSDDSNSSDITTRPKKRPKVASSSTSESDSEEKLARDNLSRASPLLEPLPDTNSTLLKPGFFLDTIGDSDCYISSDDNVTDVENTNKNKKEKNIKEKLENGECKENNERKEMDENKKWRRDSLLTGRLPSVTSSDDEVNEEEDVKRKKKLRPNMRKFTTEEDLANLSTEEENECRQENKRKRKDSSSCSTTPASISSESSEDSSDVEFVDQTMDSGENRFSRRNIRAVKSEETLAEETRRAISEEQKRVERLKPKKETLWGSCQNASEEMGLVLDIDRSTAEPVIVVDNNITKRLKEHQKNGVQFMWDNCYESLERLKVDKGTGCILAHCMGLGKTFQVIALIHTLFKYPETKTSHVLIICPLSTVLNWENEFKLAFADLRNVNVNVNVISDSKAKAQKLGIVEKWRRNKGVLIMGYETFVSLVKGGTRGTSSKVPEASYKALIDPGPDLVVCDEGHLIKNSKNHRTKALMRVTTKRRIVLTGTPLQNNLMEYYQMVQFVKPHLLGTWQEFSNRFVNPIMNGGYHDSTPNDIKLMRQRSHILHESLKELVQRYEVSVLHQYLPEKLDYVIFLPLHSMQIKLYKHYLELINNSENCGSGKTFLVDYMQLRNVWSHPYMLKLRAQEKPKPKKGKEVDVILTEPIVTDSSNVPKDWWHNQVDDDICNHVEYGPKILIALSIIEECEKVGDKLIIFSQNLSHLSTIEHFLHHNGTRSCKSWVNPNDYLRMDGNIPPEMRTRLCKRFAEKPNVRLFLISHNVGGMGLNLVAANRVILMDVSFNPALDNQSIFRIYRFGQSKRCYIYRLVSMGTMEEVVYERCVNKSAISARVIDEQQISRHYKSNDLQRMYRFDVYTDKERPILKLPEDELLAKMLDKHKNEIFKYHIHQDLLENLLEEQLNEEEQKIAWDEFRKEQEQGRQQALQVKVGQQVPQQAQVLTVTPNTTIETLSNIKVNRSLGTIEEQNGKEPANLLSTSDISSMVVLNDEEIIDTIPVQKDISLCVNSSTSSLNELGDESNHKIQILETQSTHSMIEHPMILNQNVSNCVNKTSDSKLEQILHVEPSTSSSSRPDIPTLQSSGQEQFETFLKTKSKVKDLIKLARSNKKFSFVTNVTKNARRNLPNANVSLHKETESVENANQSDRVPTLAISKVNIANTMSTDTPRKPLLKVAGFAMITKKKNLGTRSSGKGNNLSKKHLQKQIVNNVPNSSANDNNDGDIIEIFD